MLHYLIHLLQLRAHLMVLFSGGYFLISKALNQSLSLTPPCALNDYSTRKITRQYSKGGLEAIVFTFFFGNICRGNPPVLAPDRQEILWLANHASPRLVPTYSVSFSVSFHRPDRSGSLSVYPQTFQAIRIGQSCFPFGTALSHLGYWAKSLTWL